MRRFFSTILFTTLSITAAVAVDFKSPIRNIDGTSIPVSADDKTPLTLGKIAEDALIANNLPGDTLGEGEKNKRFWLAMKVHANKESFSVDEIALIKKVINLAYGPLVVGRATELLDPASVPK